MKRLKHTKKAVTKAGFSMGALGSAVIPGLGTITPVGWAVIAIGAAVVGGSIVYSKEKSRYRREEKKKGKGAKKASAGETQKV